MRATTAKTSGPSSPRREYRNTATRVIAAPNPAITRGSERSAAFPPIGPAIRVEIGSAIMTMPTVKALRSSTSCR
jgi:hypothetical protein